MSTMTKFMGDVAPVTAKAAVVAAKPSSFGLHFTKPDTKTSLVPGLAAGALGAYRWKKHRVLGFLMGDVLGGSAYGIYQGGQARTDGLCRVATVGAGTFAALRFRRHPVLGFLGGAVAAHFASGFLVRR